MRVRAFDLRIKHVSVPLRKARRLCSTGHIDRQRREKRVARFGARVFFTASNAPFFVTVKGVRYAQWTHGQRCQPVLGPMHLFQRICQPSKYISTQKRKRSKAVKLHDGTPWRTLLCSDNDLRA